MGVDKSHNGFASGEVSRRAEHEALYRRQSRELWALAYARCMKSDLAMASVQQAFADLWHEGEGVEDAAAWLRVRVGELADAAPHDSSNSTGEPPEFQALRRELRELSEQQRAIVALHYALDYTTEQIARVLEMPANAVQQELSAVRHTIGAELLAIQSS